MLLHLRERGAFPENHPLAMGPIGMHGHTEANRIILEADCILAVGARFSDRSVGRFDEFGKGMNIIHLDIDPVRNREKQISRHCHRW